MKAAFQYVTVIKGCTTSVIFIQMESKILIYSPSFLERRRLITISPVNGKSAKTGIINRGKGAPRTKKTFQKY